MLRRLVQLRYLLVFREAGWELIPAMGDGGMSDSILGVGEGSDVERGGVG